MRITDKIKKVLEEITKEEVAVISDKGLFRVYAQTNPSIDFRELMEKTLEGISEFEDNGKAVEGKETGNYRKWITMEDDKVCYLCRQLHGKVAKVGEPFTVIDKNGNVIKVYEPPLHPHCRCRTVEV